MTDLMERDGTPCEEGAARGGRRGLEARSDGSGRSRVPSPNRSVRRLFRHLTVTWMVALAAACGGGAGEGESGAQGEIPAGLVQPRRANETAPDTYRALFETTEGEFAIQAHRDWAPRAADRFYNLIRVGYYDSVYVHRVIPDRVAQFGIHPDPRINYVWQQAVIQDDPMVQSNERGTVSFAMSGPNSRTTQVFINLGDNPGLDEQGFAPFGEVVEGMEVVDSLYGGYGDGPPRGEGPYPAQAAAEGNAYFEREFPELDQILDARIVEP